MQSCGVHCGDCNVNIYYLPFNPLPAPTPQNKKGYYSDKNVFEYYKTSK